MTQEKNRNNPTGKALQLLQAIMALKGQPFRPDVISQATNIPVANIYRYLDDLLKAELIIRPRRGTYLPHPLFVELMGQYSSKEVLSVLVRPYLEKLSRTLPVTLHFGILEADMVTYLVKVTAKEESLFTEENMQLEAYCTGIGKVLLGRMPDKVIDNYLREDSFPALTRYTLTDPAKIRSAILDTRLQSYGTDDREIYENLVCLAVPVFSRSGQTVGAISAASTTLDLLGNDFADTLEKLNNTAKSITALL